MAIHDRDDTMIEMPAFQWKPDWWNVSIKYTQQRSDHHDQTATLSLRAGRESLMKMLKKIGGARSVYEPH